MARKDVSTPLMFTGKNKSPVYIKQAEHVIAVTTDGPAHTTLHLISGQPLVVIDNATDAMAALGWAEPPSETETHD